jgi:hypothetical protein
MNSGRLALGVPMTLAQPGGVVDGQLKVFAFCSNLMLDRVIPCIVSRECDPESTMPGESMLLGFHSTATGHRLGIQWNKSVVDPESSSP